MDVKGRFFKYRSGTGLIRVRASNGGYVDLLPGQGVWNLNYDSLNVQDRSGVQNAGVLIAGDFDFHDDRITGTVDVVDGGYNRTAAGVAFMAAVGIGGAVGLFGEVQLWNPAGSGKNLIIESIMPAGVGPAQLNLIMTTAALPSMVSLPACKMAGKPSGVAQARTGSLAAASIGPVIGIFIVPTTKTETMKLVEPVILIPGTGLNVSNLTENSNTFCNYEYFEQAV